MRVIHTPPSRPSFYYRCPKCDSKRQFKLVERINDPNGNRVAIYQCVKCGEKLEYCERRPPGVV